MAEGFITRRGGVAAVEQVAAPTITQVSLAETSITFTIKNNDTSAATIVYRISSSTADGESFTLAADTTSANITIGGLDEDTSYTIFASANVEGKVKSNLTEFPFTTLETPTFISATGGTTTTYTESGKNYKSHTFTSSGNFVVNSLSNQSALNEVDYLIIAGGGGGGNRSAGGGGAGGVIIDNFSVTATSYEVIIGGGGEGGDGDPGQNGSNSTVFNFTSLGGGGGGTRSGAIVGKDGGSGGGGGGNVDGNLEGGTGLQPASNDGGFGNDGGTSASLGGGGGGGANNAGQNGSSNAGGNGGNGLVNTLRTGSNETRAGGGGGGGLSSAGSGGSGGGGNGGNPGQNATVNTGSGGGGGRETTQIGGNGGSGIVVIRYEVGAL